MAARSSSPRADSWSLAVGAVAVGVVGAVAYGAYRGAAAAFRPHYPDTALTAGAWLVHRPRRVLALAGATGELELFAGGTLALLAAGDSRTCAAVVSEGEDQGRLRDLGHIHRREQESAAAVLEYDRLVWLPRPLESVEDQLALHRDLERLVAEEDPEVILAPDPRGAVPGGSARGGAVQGDALRGRRGPARRGSVRAALGHAVLNLARSALARDRAVLLYGTRQPNVLVDITETLQEKQTAVKCHRSRLVGPDALAGRAVRRISRLGQERVPAMYVEGFYRLV